MISLEEKIAIIANTEIFSSFPRQHLQAIAARMGERHYKNESLIFAEEDSGKHMLIIYRGQVDIIKGKTTVLATLEEGDILGEMAPILGEKRSTSARAKGEVSVLFLKGEALRLLMHKIPELAIGIMQLICKRLKKANEVIQNLGKRQSGFAYRLEVTNVDKLQTLSLGNRLEIGRGNPKGENPMRLNLQGSEKSKISRHHAEIFYRNGHYFIKDLGSRNGTKLNDIPLKEIIALQEEDKIQIGEASLCFRK